MLKGELHKSKLHGWTFGWWHEAPTWQPSTEGFWNMAIEAQKIAPGRQLLVRRARLPEQDQGCDSTRHNQTPVNRVGNELELCSP